MLLCTDLECATVVILLFVFAFRSCDKYGLGVITPHEFRGALEKRLGYTMSDKQWDQLKNDVGQDADGLIPYNKFLQLFDVMYVFYLFMTLYITT